MICTFYSYKGGVGRSMALANVGDVLSRRGLRVLMIDFDLEAPGLEQFFYRGDETDERDAIRGQTGLLDLLLAYKEAMSLAGGGEGFRALDRYIATIFGHRPGGGRLDLLPAGQRLSAAQLSHYAQALRSFDWQDFYFNWEGDLFFEWLRRALIPERYDVVLIDSRTGVTEMGGICGYQLADVIVMLCGANHQNVDGTWSMLHDFRSQPVADLRRGRALEIVVVPARLEQRTPELTQAFFERFEARFGGLLPPRMAEAGLSFRDLTIPYDPQFAFEERVARSPAEQVAKEHLAQVFGTLADVITLLAPAGPGRLAEQALALRFGKLLEHGEAVRVFAEAPAAAIGQQAPAAKYDETKRFAEFDVLLSFARHDGEAAMWLHDTLTRAGLRVLADTADVAVQSDWQARLHEALTHACALALCVGRAPLARSQHWLLERALQAREAGRPLAIVAVLMPGHEADVPREAPLHTLPHIDLRGGPHDEVVGRAIELLRPGTAAAREAVAAAPEVELEERCPYVGAVPFDEHQADLFFGRGDEILRLIAALASHRLVVLTGASACGKSSLLRAGLLPALRRSHPDWRPIEARSARDALRALAQAPTPGDGAVGTVTTLLVLDADAAAPDASTHAALDAAIRTLIEHGGRMLLSVRRDRLDAWLALAAATARDDLERVTLGRPDATALRAIIERPADAAGLAFEPGLVDRILNRAVGEAGVLPFVQLALQRLWQQRRRGWLTNAAYDGFGGLRAIVTEAADRHYESLAANAQAEMRRIMLRLVQIAAGSARSSAQRLARDALGAADSPAARVLDGMVAAHLLVSDADRDGASIEVAHEALARDWPRLMIWLEQERDFLAWRARLEVELDAWRRAGRSDEQLLRGALLDEAEQYADGRDADLRDDERAFIQASAAARDATRQRAERQRNRRLRLFATAAGVFLAVAAVAALGWVQAIEREAELQRKSAVLARQLAELERGAATTDVERQAAERRLAELEATLSGLLDTTRRIGEVVVPPGDTPGSDEGDLVLRQEAGLERALSQTRAVAEQQRALSIQQQVINLQQQSVLREVLKKDAPPPAAN